MKSMVKILKSHHIGLSYCNHLLGMVLGLCKGWTLENYSCVKMVALNCEIQPVVVSLAGQLVAINYQYVEDGRMLHLAS